MMVLSKQRESSPKDLGIDLLVIKEKRRREDALIPQDFVVARESDAWQLDPAGCIRIGIVPGLEGENGLIIAEHENVSIVGKDARSVLDTIIQMGLISTLDHAGYLGRELEKAELALRYNRSYAQDDDF